MTFSNKKNSKNERNKITFRRFPQKKKEYRLVFCSIIYPSNDDDIQIIIIIIMIIMVVDVGHTR